MLSRRFLPILALFVLGSAMISAAPWRSSLYPEDWTPPAGHTFNAEPFIQDFSYAGYRYNELPLPNPDGPIFSVTDYGADPSGSRDSTAAIQATIDITAAYGGGVVYLPAGTYKVAPPMAATEEVLLVNHSNIIIRGAGADVTRIHNTGTFMRNKAVIRIANASGSWLNETSTRIPITANLTGPVTTIPLTSVSGFSVGESIVLHAEATPAWITEHQMDTPQYWLDKGSSLGGVAFYRDIIDIDSTANTLTIDTPIRYSLKTRDNAAVFRTRPQLTGIGIEHLSIGNTEHPGTSGWAENDYNNASLSAYDVHDSWLIRMENNRHSWIRDVQSFAPAGNALGSHMLSNGILILHSRNITLRDCDMSKVEYGGGGGNGYTFRFQNSQEVLMLDSAARFQRHGIVQSHMRNSGHVFHRVLTQDTHTQTAGSGSTSGGGSDHHMHFSQAMLFDMAVAERDYFDAAFRYEWGTVAHGLSSTNSVYWNTTGLAKHPRKGHLVLSDQYGYGYIIGTSGAYSVASNAVSTSRTSPPDIIEGAGNGESLQPQSLYVDQVFRRTGKVLAEPGIRLLPSSQRTLVGASATTTLAASVEWNMPEPDGRIFRWTQVNGPSATIYHPEAMISLVTLSQPGNYTFRAHADNGWYSQSTEIELTLSEETTKAASSFATDDAHVRGTPYDENNFGSATELQIKYARLDFQREAFCMFPIPSSVNEALAAYIELTVSNAGELPLVEAFATATSWTESSLTWNERPSTLETLSTFSPTTGKVKIPIDLPLLLDRFNDGQPLSIGLRTSDETTAITTFASRENSDADAHPRLVLILSAPTPYEVFATNAFGASVIENNALEAKVWGKSADPDHDGVLNYFEWLTASDPNVPSLQALEIRSNDGTQVVKFTVAHNVPFPILQISTDCVKWIDIPLDLLNPSAISPTATTIFYQPPAQLNHYFIRLIANP